MSDVEAYKRQLLEQWKWNHSEHCTAWTEHGPSGCHWPLPTILGGDPAAWRPYEDEGQTPTDG